MSVKLLPANIMNLNFNHTVHKERLGHCLVEIFDTRKSRSLFFGGKYLQSQMLHKNPEQLALIYTRYMVSALILIKQLRRVLVIGVGAGSFIHFLHHHFPSCHIDCVDRSEKIIEIAQIYFGLKECEQVSIHCCGGREFLASTPSASPYDLILVDAFDEKGMAAGIYEPSFFKLCDEKLHRDGVAGFNLWHDKKSVVSAVIGELRNKFPHNYLLPIPHRGNVVANVMHKPIPWQRLLPDKKKCRQMQEKYKIEFRTIGRLAIKNNMSLPQRLHWYLERNLGSAKSHAEC